MTVPMAIPGYCQGDTMWIVFFLSEKLVYELLILVLLIAKSVIFGLHDKYKIYTKLSG